MNSPLNRIKTKLLKGFLVTPYMSRYSNRWYNSLGVKGHNFRISSKVTIVGDYQNLELGENAEINTGCFLLLKDNLIMGKNSTLAYQASILTSSNPNGPHNKLAKLYPKTTKPVIIGDNSWIGAKSIILPGVSVGNFSIVAAGAVVNKDVADYTVVAGVPAKAIKHLNPDDFK